jgi:hypothetical protein
VEVERTVDAPMERVWALLRDYRVARPRLLSEHFSDSGVQEHGDGPGTVTPLAYTLQQLGHSAASVGAVEMVQVGHLDEADHLADQIPARARRAVFALLGPNGAGKPW